MRKYWGALGFLAVLMIAGNALAGPRDEADDRFYEAVLGTPHDRVVDGAQGRAGDSNPFMVANDGSAATFIVGCQRTCSIHLKLRALGLPEMRVDSAAATHDRLVFQIPASYSRSLSNFEVDLDLSCGGGPCAYHWALLSSGSPASLQARGLPAAPSAADLNAGGTQGGAIVWTARPTGDDLRFFYPVDSLRHGAAGAARLQCLVGNGGVLRCRTGSESPAGAGFGDAALRLSSTLRVQMTDASGQPALNRRVDVPIRFALEN